MLVALDGLLQQRGIAPAGAHLLDVRALDVPPGGLRVPGVGEVVALPPG